MLAACRGDVLSWPGSKGVKICYNNGSEPMQKGLTANFIKHFNADIHYFYAY